MKGREQPATSSRARTSGHVRLNLALWERQSDAYDRRSARVLGGKHALAWGFWRIPEEELRLLGPVRSKDVLELGCGAARWAHALSRHGARVVGLDLSWSQLDKARRGARGPRRAASLVRADAERLPFRPATFDLVFSDWGAMTFCNPYRTVPEIARVLRPGGRLVFATSSPFRAVTQSRRSFGISPRLRFDYFDLGRIDYPGEVNFVLGYGAWIDLFARCGLEIHRLVETDPPPRARSRYLSLREEKWGRRWPLEAIWAVRRPPAGRSKAG